MAIRATSAQSGTLTEHTFNTRTESMSKRFLDYNKKTLTYQNNVENILRKLLTRKTCKGSRRF